MGRPKIEETPQQIQDRQRIAIMIRILRSALGLSQLELSELVGLSYSGIAKLEKGTMRLNRQKTDEILRIFDQAGLIYHQNRGRINITIPKDTLSKLYGNDLVWPVSVDQPITP